MAERDAQLVALNEAVTERDAQLVALNEAVTERDAQLVALNEAVTERDIRISGMQQSRSWRLTRPLRGIGGGIRALRRALGRLFGKMPPIRQARIRRIRKSPLFDADFYAERNPDVVAAGVDLAKHYALSGWKEHRNPSAEFSTRRYLQANPDVAAAGINPLLHYIDCGKAEGRQIFYVEEDIQIADCTKAQRILDCLNEPVSVDCSVPWRYSRFMYHIWKSRSDLQRVFDLNNANGREAFANWYLLFACHEYQLRRDAYPSYLLQEFANSSDAQVRKAAGELLSVKSEGGGSVNISANPDGKITIDAVHEAGANLIGYARGEFGMGEHVRMVARACAAAEVPFSVIDFGNTGFHGRDDKSVDQWLSNEQKCGINIFNVNADVFPDLFFRLGSEFFNDFINVGYWAWELENCPEDFDLSLNMVDEVWAVSEFVRDAFAQRAKVPVINMPLAISIPELKREYSRGDFGLFEDEFIFLFIFDAASHLDRKNPIAVVKAFKSAFQNATDKVRLVLKTMNVPENDPLWIELISEIDGDARIEIMTRKMTRDEVLGLHFVCDVFVSLHRSEGFGLCIAESMCMGKPVIVTNYSGSRDFANEATACAVDYKLVPVPEGHYPYWCGQIWAEPDYQHAALFMRKLHDDPAYRRQIAEAGQRFIQTNFNEHAIGIRYRERLVKLAKRKSLAKKLIGGEEQSYPKGICSNALKERLLCAIDAPQPDPRCVKSVRGVFDIAGWAISDMGVPCVEVCIDGKNLTGLHYGVLRPDVGDAYPDFENSARSGFFCRFDSSEYPDGIHTIEITVTGVSGETLVCRRDFRIDNSISEYDEWLLINDPNASANLQASKAIFESLTTRPFLSLVCIKPAANISAIMETFRSLSAQVYPDWEVVCDEKNRRTEILRLAEEFGFTDRVRFVNSDERGLLGVLDACKGAYVGLMDFGDCFERRAMLAFAHAFSCNSSLEFVYADEDRLSSGKRCDPVFKPVWSPTFYEQLNYIGRPWMAKVSCLIELVEGEESSNRDLESIVHRGLAKKDRAVSHIPMVLCSRNLVNICPIDTTARTDFITATKVYGSQNNQPLVSIIIPTCVRDPRVVEKCLTSLYERTAYDKFEVIIVANNLSNETYAAELFQRWPVAVVYYVGNFNWSALNNFGARKATGDYLLFMNDDVEILGKDWLASMVQSVQCTGVGVVGATLRYPNGTIQHAGISLSTSPYGVAMHKFRFCNGQESFLHGWYAVDRECVAVTGACMMSPASVFWELGGFDEKFAVICNDTDYCLRVGQAGYRCLVKADLGLIHHEGISRAGIPESSDTELFRRRWGWLLERGDPYSNPNLDSTTELPKLNTHSVVSMSVRSSCLCEEIPAKPTPTS